MYKTVIRKDNTGTWIFLESFNDDASKEVLDHQLNLGYAIIDTDFCVESVPNPTKPREEYNKNVIFPGDIVPDDMISGSIHKTINNIVEAAINEEVKKAIKDFNNKYDTSFNDALSIGLFAKEKEYPLFKECSSFWKAHVGLWSKMRKWQDGLKDVPSKEEITEAIKKASSFK
jgi:hypothetical protein